MKLESMEIASKSRFNKQLGRVQIRQEIVKQREGINPTAKPTGTGCVDCLATDGLWLHLRRCFECGRIGCSYNSPDQHASKHNASTGHPIITSFEHGENWFYDYRTGDFFARPSYQVPTSTPWTNPCLDRWTGARSMAIAPPRIKCELHTSVA